MRHLTYSQNVTFRRIIISAISVFSDILGCYDADPEYFDVSKTTQSLPVYFDLVADATISCETLIDA